VPFAAQAEWKPLANRADPVDVLIEQGKSRIQELLPVRYSRMKADPFAFLRGAAAIMAADLGAGSSTGLRAASLRRLPSREFWRLSQSGGHPGL